MRAQGERFALQWVADGHPINVYQEGELNYRVDSTCEAGAGRVAPLRRSARIVAVCSILLLGAVAYAAPGTVHARAKAAQAATAPVKTYGSSSAPIKMEVFSDYECPSCRNLYEQTLRPMIADYVAAGKVYLIHRDFPLPMHKYGYEASRWANAAARVGQFENVEAALYDNQPAWSTDGNIEKFIAAAMPAADFKRVQKLMEGCTQASAVAEQGRMLNVAQATHVCSLDPYINEDRALGTRIPVQATPTYVITYKGKRLPAGSGVVSWPILKQFFDSLLRQ
jgi:protein-disulfide isomerase